MKPSDTLTMIQYIRLTGKKLSVKEEGFISSCFVQAKADRKLTEKQAKWLQDIYGKVTE